ncbi:AAA-like domain-containing protein (plasmid) [Candidatus Chlorohelix allophototropha]|uniref:non-specific serine/threonine protein kinase n=1 Tax=Candidatus Chlorohelix allophototropha TaxID=3003348 RepID=A0ABY9BBK9_9CHLR|nr:AAA-like domain-containing protein [Chloroflexota bacterium L227-S17]
MSQQFQIGAIIAGKYQIKGEIGSGGLGSVYLATDLKLKRAVAIKTLRHNRTNFSQQLPGTFEEYLARFEREAAISSYFTANPNIITVFGLEQDETQHYYLIMEYFEGGSLSDLLKREGKLSIERACAITLDLCRALAEIHRHPADIVHRDLKPANVLLRANGQAVIADFGVAQIGHESKRESDIVAPHPGSQPYMSPEQRGNSGYLTPASDLYSLGLLLYEMLVGKMYSKIKKLPPSQLTPAIPVWLDSLLIKLLDNEPEKRYQQAEEVLSELQKGLDRLKSEEETAETTPLPGREKKADTPLHAEPYSEPVPLAQLLPLEKPEGTMSTQSHFYIERQSDPIALETIRQQGVTITIKAPRQMGKSSLLLRVREEALKQKKQVALLDFQLIDKPALTNPDLFFRQFCDWLTDELELASKVTEYWETPLGNSQRTTRYMQRYLLKTIEGPLVLAMDEVDRIFDTPFRSDFFGMLRSWHNSRQSQSLWQQLDLVLVTSTEPYQLIEDLNQSPFNVGEVIELADFSGEQVVELNRRYQTPLSPQELAKLITLLGGHPYLVRRGLYLVASGRITAQELFSRATQEQGPFGDHLRNHLFRLYEREELVEGMRQVLQKQQCLDERVYFRLRGAGLVKREGRLVVPRCQLYSEYFRAVALEQGQIPASPLASEVGSGAAKTPLAGLSERELEVLKLVVEGMTNAQIAEKLVLSIHTVNSHVSSIYGKLEVTSRTEAARYATQHKLV